MRFVTFAAAFLIVVSLAAAARAASVSSIVKLARSGVSDDVILALVEKDGTRFELNADDILDLRAQGVSDRVIVALLRNGRGTPPPDGGAAGDAQTQDDAIDQPAGDPQVVVVPPPPMSITLVMPTPVVGFVPFFVPVVAGRGSGPAPVIRIGTRPFFHPSPFIDPRLVVQPIVDPQLDRLGISAIIPRH